MCPSHLFPVYLAQSSHTNHPNEALVLFLIQALRKAVCNLSIRIHMLNLEIALLNAVDYPFVTDINVTCTSFLVRVESICHSIGRISQKQDQRSTG